MLLAGRMVRDPSDLGFGLDTDLYDERWLPQGFPLSDARKADITFDQVFRHASGMVPEAENPAAMALTRAGEASWSSPVDCR